MAFPAKRRKRAPDFSKKTGPKTRISPPRPSPPPPPTFQSDAAGKCGIIVRNAVFVWHDSSHTMIGARKNNNQVTSTMHATFFITERCS